ncbi:tRNA (adenosine(37)-N6)-threonylcarbamoyltransferase complex dimerization subunit type 1 TsaB [Curvibacter sp. PAE-UM]|uniref:tRNA (adenosine(37)-N6)-threonylcarbamoyltransferase complex dimerization subunit type 1 TsaB n=1 Tax=Curvibacter sp. PAE-UM TaxID=1714344 RepID=UPI00070AEF28|nr:tRNA (adenosine(37)-N6)-threonylcarbamoyltransferase complex dimerization subunit type 1 TsaB [Curvibacter sp. PAE-UM]KRH99322.1 tRNA threonylcarbamoyladenosine biosynthesis protein TsaB [Curvibacter sp. PAE-UM]
MKLLAFDTSTELISIAVTRQVDGQARMWQHTGAGGAQASSAMIPAIETLMAEAGLRFEELDAIAFGRGPGSFTGLRTACAVAQGLGFGANVPLLPVDTLLAVAEEARAQQAPQQQNLRLLALLDARMGELYAARYAYAAGSWQQQADFSLLKPEQLVLGDAQALAGNVFAEYGERLSLPPELPCWQALPTAAAMLRLAPTLLAAGNAVAAADALPRYIRDKVAQTTQERAAAKAAIDTR